MSVTPSALQLREANFGFLVSGGAKTLPASTTGHIFTVAGGRIILTSLVGTVTTVIQTQACTISVGNTPSGGSGAATSLSIASASVSALAVGATLALPPAQASALFFGAASGVLPGNGSGTALGVPVSSGGIAVVPAGTIDWTTSATNTGAISWSVTYVPFDVGATVTAL
jgi:hypothetical protein